MEKQLSTSEIELRRLVGDVRRMLVGDPRRALFGVESTPVTVPTATTTEA